LGTEVTDRMWSSGSDVVQSRGREVMGDDAVAAEMPTKADKRNGVD